MKPRTRICAAPLQTRRGKPAPKRSPNRSNLKLDEAPRLLKVMANAPSALRAYILADAALVRGKLTRRQRAQVTLAEREIKGWADSASAQRGTGAGLRSRDKGMQLARRANAALSKTLARLSFTLAAVLQRGKRNSNYSQALLKAGFTREQIAEIIGNIALNTFANHFTHDRDGAA